MVGGKGLEGEFVRAGVLQRLDAVLTPGPPAVASIELLGIPTSVSYTGAP